MHFRFRPAPPLPKARPTEITLIEPKARPRPIVKIRPQPMQIVEQEKTKIESENKQANFLSAQNQHVAKQTIAKKTGTFHNTKTPQPKEELSKSDEPSTKSQSQSDDVLKDVDKGISTMLSTKQFSYFNYYSSIKQKVKVHWEPLLGQKVQPVLRQSRGLASGENHVTKLLLIIDRDGNLKDVTVLRSSGIGQADSAAVEAFQNASPFSAPPKELIDENGEVQMRWDLVLEQTG